MKQLTWRLIIPLTVISFSMVTKWWYVLPDDAPDSMMSGFPFPYVCNAWYTSMALQFFVLEFTVDLICYFLVWVTLVYVIHKYLYPLHVSRIPTILLTTLAGIFIAFAALVAGFPENQFYLQRHFDIKVLKTGYKFIWSDNTRPENMNLHEYQSYRLDAH